MGKSKFKAALRNVQLSLSKHSPEILTGLGIAGMVTTTVLAVRATPKALRLLEAEVDRQNEELSIQASQNGDRDWVMVTKLKPVDAIKVAWKCYIPAAISGSVSIACLIGASSVHVRRNAILATAYKLSESALTEYKEKVIETIGEKKEQAVRDKIVQDKVDKNPPSNNEIIVTGRGNTKCLDVTSGRYFMSDIEKIRRAVNELNAQMYSETYVSLSDFYDLVGISPSKISDKIGWNLDDRLVELCTSAVLDENEEPCIGIDFRKAPHYGFDKLF